MRKYFSFFLLAFMVSASSNILLGQTHYQWHSALFTDWYGTGVQTSTQTLGGIEYENVTAKATVGGTSAFVIEWDGGYNRWKNGAMVLDNVSTLTWYANCNTNNPGDSYLTTTSVLNSYYTLRIKQRAYSDRSAIIMKTTNSPVAINSVSDNFLTRGEGNPGTVSITLSATPSPEEKVFVRYTTDGWATSSFIQATGSGANYTASVPNEIVKGTDGNDYYYVLTTTVSTPTNANADLITLALNNNGGSNFILPVELTAFSGRATKEGITLIWNTATEESNTGFEVERSLDKNTWQKIGFVNGNGNSNSPKDYTYTDSFSFNGICYYRLKQIDTDGKYTYSKVIEIKGTGNVADFNLAQNYPNPFNPCTNINFSLNESGKAKLVVYDILGKERAVLFNGNVEAGKNYNVSFNGSNMESGVYFYKLTSGSVTSVKKMMLVK